MRRPALVLAAATAALAAAAGGLALRARAGSPVYVPTADTGAAASRIAPAAGALVARARYRLAYEQEVTVAGRPAVMLRAAGAWVATPRADGRTEVRFSPSALEGPGAELPRREDLAAEMQLVREDGVLAAIGFPGGLPAPAKKLLTGIATTFQYTDRSGASWAAAEEDLTGRYDAAYAHEGRSIVRARPRYTALRGADGLTSDGAGGASPTERTRFTVDADGVVTAAVELDVAFSLGAGFPEAKLRLRGTLVREAIERVPAAGGPALAAAPISGHADFEGAKRNADESLVADATVADLLAEARQVAALPGKSGGDARAQTLARLAAMIRVEPGAAAEIAARLRAPGADAAEVRLLAGALGSSRVAAGTDALAELAGLSADALPDASRGAVIGSLSFSEPVTPAGIAALSAGIDRAHGAQAALGLGTHGRKARAQDAAAADAAAGALLDRLASAASPAERKLYLEALGNSGAPRALPALRAALEGGDRPLAEAAVYSLRFVPGTDADALLERALSQREVAFMAVRAAAYRDPSRFRPLLLAARARFPEHAGIQTEILAIFSRWDG